MQDRRHGVRIRVAALGVDVVAAVPHGGDGFTVPVHAEVRALDGLPGGGEGLLPHQPPGQEHPRGGPDSHQPPVQLLQLGRGNVMHRRDQLVGDSRYQPGCIEGLRPQAVGPVGDPAEYAGRVSLPGQPLVAGEVRLPVRPAQPVGGGAGNLVPGHGAGLRVLVKQSDVHLAGPPCHALRIRSCVIRDDNLLRDVRKRPGIREPMLPRLGNTASRGCADTVHQCRFRHQSM